MNKMEWFWIYKTESWYYTFIICAGDLFDLARELDDYFGTDISSIKLIMPYNEVDISFINALSESPNDDNLIKYFLSKVNGSK